MGIRVYLNRTLSVWRTSTVSDGMGGSATETVEVGVVKAKVDQPSADERMVAQQDGSYHSHRIYMKPDVDVRRGDELRGDGQSFRVISVVQPSRPVYSKAFVELIETEGDA